MFSLLYPLIIIFAAAAVAALYGIPALNKRGNVTQLSWLLALAPLAAFFMLAATPASELISGSRSSRILVVTGRSHASVDPAVAELSQLGEVLGQPCDVANLAACQALAWLLSRFRPDGGTLTG